MPATGAGSTVCEAAVGNAPKNIAFCFGSLDDVSPGAECVGNGADGGKPLDAAISWETHLLLFSVEPGLAAPWCVDLGANPSLPPSVLSVRPFVYTELEKLGAYPLGANAWPYNGCALPGGPDSKGSNSELNLGFG